MVSLELSIAPCSVGTKRVNERQPIVMKRLRHLTRRASGPVRGVAAREALCGKSVEPFASLEPGCPVRCTPALGALRKG